MLILLVLLVVTAGAYAPAWHGAPVWDDAGHLTRPDLQSLDGLRRIWVSPGATQQYYPVTHTAFWLQHQLWADNTLGYHLVNIALHVWSAWLVGLILLRLGVPGAWLAAGIFALHPVHVESVAWMSELKNTLSGAWVLSAVWVYLRWDTERTRGLYIAALALFAAALLSKSVTAPLPVVLALILWWQRGVLKWKDDLRPLVPFVALAAVAGVMTVAFEQWGIGVAGEAFGFSLVERSLIAGRASWFYLGSLVWPSSLAFNYPRWTIDAGLWWQYLYPLGLCGVIGGLWIMRHRWGRGPLTAVLVFLAAVGPALGFVDAYPFRFSFVADHFQYLASISVIALAATGITRVVTRPSMIAVTAAVVCLPLALITWQQSHHYQDEESLYRATLVQNPDSWLAHTNLSALLVQRPGGDAQALVHARHALRLKPDSPVVQYNVGVALERTGHPADAVSHYREAVAHFGEVPPEGRNLRLGQVQHRLGAALAAVGRLDDAIAAYRAALRHRAADPDIHLDLGMALAHQRDFEGAVTHFTTAVQLRPDPAAFNNLGGVAMQAGRFDDAVHWLEQATALDPTMVDAFYNLGTALMRLERWVDAAQAYQRVLVMAGPSPDLLTRVGALLAQAGDRDQARRHFRQALQLDPTHAEALAALRGGGL